MEDSTLKQTSAIPLILLFQILLSSLPTSFSSDTLTPSESLSFNQTLISSDQTFELGFFSAGDKKFYLGIWFYNLPVQTIVWVANRDSPSKSSSINLKFGDSGNIILADNAGANPVWSSDNVSGDGSLVLQLLDTGNLVIREAHDTNPENYIWQSFDHPTDTILSGQKLGWTKNPELDRFLTSWASPNDPSSGNYTFRMNRSGDPELFLLKSGIERIHRSGPWVGSRFSGIPEMKSTMALNFTFKDTPEDVYYSFFLLDPSLKFRVVLETGGFFSRYVWVPDRKTWNRFWFAPKNQCDNYLPCGPYGVCDANNLLVCGCPKGFTPKNPKAWGMRYSGDGCERKTQLECKTDGFLNLKGMKLPESGVDVVVDRKKTLTECKEMCRKDCNCTAYANTEVVAGVGSGCIMWRSDLLDLTTFGDVGGQDLFVRLASSDLETSKAKKALIIGVTVPIGAAILALAIAACFICMRKRKSTKNSEQRAVRSVTTERSQEILLSGTITSVKRDTFVDNGADDLELPLFDFDALAMATENFIDDNKLGQGGFGCVYKGVLENGQEVAVKRLSKESGQGAEEFKNEAKVIAKLQHRNLVRLLGCCVDRDEKMLVYEYLPNKSLHSVLFKKERSFLLDWERRFNIICGIARGLVYLHHDSRLRIIHRDLKASNVLLDHEMNPKISDFGMARIFGEDEMETSNTLRIVGTYGYMSPEYAMDGVFSIKSDVFSFGVLILEIVTGKKNKGFYNKDHELNLLGYAWKMWREGKGTELLDSSMGELYSAHEVLRCIQVGLLCVQERPEERPTMSTVVLLLSSDSASLPRPKLPGFCMGWRPDDADYPFSQQDETFTINQVTITMVDGR